MNDGPAISFKLFEDPDADHHSRYFNSRLVRPWFRWGGPFMNKVVPLWSFYKYFYGHPTHHLLSSWSKIPYNSEFLCPFEVIAPLAPNGFRSPIIDNVLINRTKPDQTKTTQEIRNKMETNRTSIRDDQQKSQFTASQID